MERSLSGLYHGPNTSRNAQQYASEWKNTQLGSVDSLILSQLQIAQIHSRREVTFVDIGCGQRAEIFRNLVTNPADLQESRKFMQSNPDLRLKLIGLTDATDQAESDYPSFVQHSTSPDFQASLKVYPYSLSATQTMDIFLRKHGITDIQLATAIWSLPYLGPNTFSEVISTTSQALSSGGLFIGVGYGETVAGLGFNMNFNVAMELAFPQRKKTHLDPDNWKDILGQTEDKPTELDTEQLQEAQVTLSQSINALLRANILDAHSANRLEESLLKSINVFDLISIGSELQLPFVELWKKKFGVLKEKKDAKIRSLKENSDNVVINSSTDQHKSTFIIEKK